MQTSLHKPHGHTTIWYSKATGEDKVIDFVLSKFSKTELAVLKDTLDYAPNIINDLINHGLDYIMNNYNK